MSLNPISFAHEVNRQFLRYQLTAFPLSDPDLAEQARQMLGETGEESQLVKGPYVSLARSFAEGKLLGDLVKEGRLHPAVAGIAEFPRMFAHQQAVFDAVDSGNHCLVSTGTGSGKTEAFLYPILNHCFRLRDANAPPGIAAVIVYPMNALAIDQLDRLRHLLAGTGITFGMFIGSTPETRAQVANVDQMKKGEGKDKFEEYRRKHQHHPNITIAPFEERLTEEEMRLEPPRILITNVNQLEFLMTRSRDLAMFESAPLRFIVFDEAHTYSGSRGAEVSVLIRRLRAFCNKTADQVICIGTSATILDPKRGEDAGRRFAQRFFGIDPLKVSLVREIYGTESWPGSSVTPPPLGKEARRLFQETLHALDGEGDGKKIFSLCKGPLALKPDESLPWQESLYSALKGSSVVRAIYDSLGSPAHLNEATAKVWQRLGRKNPGYDDSMELLLYLALGAAAEKDGHSLLRPQMHYFIRGQGGASVVLDQATDDYTPAKLYFSRSVAAAKNHEVLPAGIFPVVSCKNCGQHFFELWMQQIDGDTEGLTGGFQEESASYWPRSSDEEGVKITFTNRFVGEIDAEERDLTDRLENRRDSAYICRFCGTIHNKSSPFCVNPQCHRQNSLVPVDVLRQHGTITTCPSCLYRGGQKGGKAWSPLKPLSAVAVADVHILAQEMINAQSADTHKIIVFADNRQEAAFQAAWMADHARRYRLRHLIYRLIADANRTLSIGDLVEQLNQRFRQDKELARALAPEVFANTIEEAYSSRTERDMKKFLRITLIRELVTSFSQRDSLEHWGKMKVAYHGITPDDAIIQQLAREYHIPAHQLVAGIETLLDMFRRSGIFHDHLEPIFSHFWHPGHEDIQRGFLPYLDYPPKGMKLRREESDRQTFVSAMTSLRGTTGAYDFIRKWGIAEDRIRPFIDELWTALTTRWNVFIPVTLQDQRGRPLPGANGVYQIDSSKVGVTTQHIRYRCTICNRIHTREPPSQSCSKIHCPGHVVQEHPPDNDYNVSLLSRDFTMLMAREHTAQVPSEDRQFIEKEFKRQNGGVNCLVATPTLELGIDIGDLDMVLLRNVPPLPANYWQRAGRAGRRHRMAVIYTYCQKKPHDEYFYTDPMRILSGTIYPPRINLRNPVMIQKHVHATLVSELLRSARSVAENPLSQADREQIQQTLALCLPPFINGYLFDADNRYRNNPPNLDLLTITVGKNQDKIKNRSGLVFSEYWPDDSRHEVSDEQLGNYISATSADLSSQVEVIHQRLMWAIHTRNALTTKEQQGTPLDNMEDKLLQRCRSYIKEIKKADLENYTLTVLARGGFLPGYAMAQGSISGFASNAFSSSWRRMTFEITRPNTLALREFIPGNLIYANAGKYKTTWFRLPFGDARLHPDRYVIDVACMRVWEEGNTPDGYAEDQITSIPGIPICDTELGFLSHVSDEEENRFRMPVTLIGNLREEHRGIDRYAVKDHEFSHLHGQKVRLVNAGPSDRVREGNLGYPLCLVCGAARSPYASAAEIQRFTEIHTKTCGRAPEAFCFTADAQVDGICFENLPSLDDAINLTEGLRMAANISLEMEPDDLQILTLTEREDCHHVVLYDPMPGGSGIIDQMIGDWKEIVGKGISTLKNCPGSCEESCYDCLKTYRNMLYHELLNRHRAVEILEEWKFDPQLVERIPPKTSTAEPGGRSTNTAEMRLADILRRHGFPPFYAQPPDIPIPGNIPRTKPDFYFESPDQQIKVTIYLDGLSKNIHGNEERQKIDHYIRTVLRAQGYHVEEIAATALDDPQMLRFHLMSIARALKRPEIFSKLENES